MKFTGNKITLLCIALLCAISLNAQHEVMVNVIGNGSTGIVEGPALETGMNGVGVFALHPDTEDIYFSNTATAQIYRYSQATKEISLFLDGVSYITGMAFNSEGFLFYGQSGLSLVHQIIKIELDADGNYVSSNVFAGTGVNGFSGDGGHALDASLGSPNGLTFDDTYKFLYFIDGTHSVLRKIDMESLIISKVAGIGGVENTDPIIEGTLATSTSVSLGLGLAIADDGSVYYTSNINEVKKIDPDGKLYTIAGIANMDGYNETDIATEAQISTQNGLFLLPEGDILLCDTGNNIIRKITPDGKIYTYAGTLEEEELDGDEKDLLNGEFQDLLASNIAPVDIKFVAGSGFYFSDNGKGRFRKIYICKNPTKPEVTVTPAEYCVGETIDLEFEGSDLGYATQWAWYKGECGEGEIIGSSTSLKDIKVEADGQKYSVMGIGGCVKDQDCGSYTIDTDCLDYYNVITPNGDSKNDFFLIPALDNYPQNKVTIYNRWGDVIANLENYDNLDVVWSGTNENKNNNSVPTGTYFFTAEADGEVLTSGWIQVIKE